MERMKKVFDKVKRIPITLDIVFRKYFEMDSAELENLEGNFHEIMASQLTVHLKDGMGCINLEIEQSAFEELKSVIKSCVEKTKLKKKGRSNANTSDQVG